MSYNPYSELAARPDWTLCFTPLPGEERGRWYDRLQTMLVRRDLTQVERRCTVAHEIEHALAGDEPQNDPVLDARREELRHRAAARKLIDFADLMRARKLYPDDPAQAAEELHVDLETLETRVRWLTKGERTRLLSVIEGEVA